MCRGNHTTACRAVSSRILCSTTSTITSATRSLRQCTAVGRIGWPFQDKRQRRGPAGPVIEQGEQLGVAAPR